MVRTSTRVSRQSRAISCERLHAPNPRHGEVQQGHIRLRFPCRLNRLLSIGSFRDNFHIGLGIDQHPQSCAENCVIIRDHDSDLVVCAPAFQVLLCPKLMG
jgi:hypothetical protein